MPSEQIRVIGVIIFESALGLCGTVPSERPPCAGSLLQGVLRVRRGFTGFRGANRAPGVFRSQLSRAA
jgi:hypothetical protein